MIIWNDAWTSSFILSHCLFACMSMWVKQMRYSKIVREKDGSIHVLILHSLLSSSLLYSKGKLVVCCSFSRMFSLCVASHLWMSAHSCYAVSAFSHLFVFELELLRVLCSCIQLIRESESVSKNQNQYLENYECQCKNAWQLLKL